MTDKSFMEKNVVCIDNDCNMQSIITYIINIVIVKCIISVTSFIRNQLELLGFIVCFAHTCTCTGINTCI